MSTTLDILYHAGMKQDSTGQDYFIAYERDSKNNPVRQKKYLVTRPASADTIRVSLRDPGSGNGHEWLVSSTGRSPIFCGSTHCPICRRYREEQEQRLERRKRIRTSLGLKG